MAAYDLRITLLTIGLGLLVFVICKIIEYLVRLNRLEKIYGELPGPKEKHWLFGSMYKFPVSANERLEHFIKICNKHGSERGYIRLWGPFGQPIIIPCSPQIVKNICKSTEPKPKGFTGPYRLLTPWLGEGLLIASGEKWARNRQLLTPAFHFDILKPYMKVYNECTEKLMAKIDGYVNRGERFELFQNISLCTLQVILKCAFSYDEDIQTEGTKNQYVQSVNRITDSISIRVGFPLLLFDSLWNLTKSGRQFKKDCEYLHTVAEEIINNRRAVLVNVIIELNGLENKSKYLDFLDILLTARDENGAGLTDQEIRNEVNTFLSAGHDTTTSALAWILYSLAEHPEYQKKCQEEIDKVLGDKEDVEWTDLPKLEYLIMCIKEGMRLHCPVPAVNRITTNDFDVGDRILPKGVSVIISIWVLSHMEKYWPDHTKFIPERFSKENLPKIEPFQYIPFSAGPRNCIGQNFAMNEEKVILSKLLRKFTFKLDKGHVIKRSLSAVMRTENGIYMYAERRSTEI